MTAIVAVKGDDNTVWMGSDSGSFCGADVYLQQQGKVFKLGEFLIGVCGDTRGGKIIRHAFKPPAIDTIEVATNEHKAGDLDVYMTTTFVNELRRTFKDAGFSKSEGGQEVAHSWLLVGVRGRIFHVDYDYCVLEDSRPYAALGSGGQVARGAL